MVDGHGIAHPRHLGIAAHFGLVTRTPTIGAAKKILYGTFEEPEKNVGAYTAIIDPKTHEELGVVLRSKYNVKPMFVSPGNLSTIPDAMRIVLDTTRGLRMPEPTRLAHNLVNQFRIGALGSERMYHFMAG